jgi:hypothetical protein
MWISEFGARVVSLAALGLVACGGANQVSGKVAGTEWGGSVKQAVYCAHCGGGPLVKVIFQRENELAVVILEFEDCASGAVARFGEAETGTARLVWLEHPNGRRIEATKGELRVEECTSSAVQASFRAELADGGQLSGKLSTPLEHDEGYD